jgi:hypothetical protein
VKARPEIGDTSLRPLQCHCKKEEKPKGPPEPFVMQALNKIVSLLIFKWVILEIWRKLFLAPRNLHFQVGRNLLHVETNRDIFMCTTPFFTSQIS